MDVLRKAVAAVSADVAGIRMDTDNRASSRGPGKARLTLDTGTAKSTFVVEVRRGILTPAALPTLEMLAEESDGRRMLVVATQVGPTVAGFLRDRSIAFMDASGNAFLAVSGLHVWIAGKRAKATRPEVTCLHLRKPATPA